MDDEEPVGSGGGATIRDTLFRRLRRASDAECARNDVAITEPTVTSIQELLQSKEDHCLKRERELTNHVESLASLSAKANTARNALESFAAQEEAHPLTRERDRLHSELHLSRAQSAKVVATHLGKYQEMTKLELARIRRRSSTAGDCETLSSPTPSDDHERMKLAQLKQKMLIERSEILAKSAAREQLLLDQIDRVKRCMATVLSKRAEKKDSRSARHAQKLAELRSAAEAAEQKMKQEHDRLVSRLKADHEKVLLRMSENEQSEIRRLEEKFAAEMRRSLERQAKAAEKHEAEALAKARMHEQSALESLRDKFVAERGGSVGSERCGGNSKADVTADTSTWLEADKQLWRRLCRTQETYISLLEKTKRELDELRGRYE